MGPYDGVESNSPYLRVSFPLPISIKYKGKGMGKDGEGWGRFLLLVGNSVADPDPGSGVRVPGSGAF